MTYTKPLLIAGIGLPVLGACGYACYAFMQPTNLKEDLMSQRFQPLSTEKDQDKEEWTKLIKAYSKAKSSPKIGNLTIELEKNTPKDEPTSEQIEQLQSACKSLFEKKKTNDSNYKKDIDLAKDWCIKESKKIENKVATS